MRKHEHTNASHTNRNEKCVRDKGNVSLRRGRHMPQLQTTSSCSASARLQVTNRVNNVRRRTAKIVAYFENVPRVSHHSRINLWAES